MRCKTQEDALTFLEFLHGLGRSWCIALAIYKIPTMKYTEKEQAMPLTRVAMAMPICKQDTDISL